jgi:glycosyltransferase involved in cell wall biosynthesis
MTAAHNEQAFIEKTLASVLRQTVLPVLWVIVSDGSTDKTDEIVETRIRPHKFIRFLKVTRAPGRSFGSKGAALLNARDLIKDVSFDFVGNLDADVELEPTYFADVIGQFERDPQLGIAAGFIYEQEQDGEFQSRATNRMHSVPHAAQLVRRECYEAIGGYAVFKYGGEDWFAQTAARMEGWRAQALPDLRIFHHRRTGAASSQLHHHFRAGQSDYSFGSDPLFEFLKCAVRMSDKPWFLGAVTRFLGFAWCCVTREKRPVSKEFVAFLRKEQRAKICAFRGKRLRGGRDL